MEVEEVLGTEGSPEARKEVLDSLVKDYLNTVGGIEVSQYLKGYHEDGDVRQAQLRDRLLDTLTRAVLQAAQSLVELESLHKAVEYPDSLIESRIQALDLRAGSVLVVHCPQSMPSAKVSTLRKYFEKKLDAVGVRGVEVVVVHGDIGFSVLHGCDYDRVQKGDVDDEDA